LFRQRGESRSRKREEKEGYKSQLVGKTGKKTHADHLLAKQGNSQKETISTTVGAEPKKKVRKERGCSYTINTHKRRKKKRKLTREEKGNAISEVHVDSKMKKGDSTKKKTGG